MATKAAESDLEDLEASTKTPKCKQNLNRKESKQFIAAAKIKSVLGKHVKDDDESPQPCKLVPLSSRPINYEVDDTNDTSDFPSEILDAPSSSETHVFAANTTDSATQIQELETKLEALSKSKQKYRAKAKELKQKVKDLEEKLKHSSSKGKVELVTGKELAGHSLMGRACNANKHCYVLPSISAVKRDALVEFALGAYNINPSITGRGVSEEYKNQKSRILASLTKLLREESKKADFVQCD
ncbi:unnamed protein product [Allacma fusca]|uniref:BEN domain-containing protein n=1 Tax=Allacma fusca TaxID=39272 RepID=A0A8J2J4W6_9HEXA|nr:unnamed protein product [Allacma fusca]